MPSDSFKSAVDAPQIVVRVGNWSEYELIDSGNRKKFERFGPVLVVRSEPKALWKPALPKSEWAKAWAVCEDDGARANWRFNREVPAQWLLSFENIKNLSFVAKIGDGSKHLGVFPEQASHWESIFKLKSTIDRNPGRPFRLLNLFGYTGAASLAAAAAGFNVTHVDASKPALSWARENQERSDSR